MIFFLSLIYVKIHIFTAPENSQRAACFPVLRKGPETWAETSGKRNIKFQYQEWQLKKSRTGFFRAFTSVLCGICGHKRGHPTAWLTDSSERVLDSS